MLFLHQLNVREILSSFRNICVAKWSISRTSQGFVFYLFLSKIIFIDDDVVATYDIKMLQKISVFHVMSSICNIQYFPEKFWMSQKASCRYLYQIVLLWD